MFEHSNPSKFECLNIGMLNILMFLPFIQSSTRRAVLAKCVRIDQGIVFCIILYALEIYNLKLNHLNGVFFGGICENADNHDNSNDEMGLNWLTMTMMMNCDGNDGNDDNDDANDNWNDEIPRKTWASGSIG